MDNRRKKLIKEKAKRKPNVKKLPKFRFMAMSKLIGVVSFGFLFIIVIYALMEMHRSQIYDALPQLIISSFAFAAVYSGFYLTMAKVEHVEEEKTKREKEIKSLQKTGNTEEIERKRQEITDLAEKVGDILSETTQYSQ